MTMTFYIGEEIKEYQKRWNELSLYFAKEMERKRLKTSKAAVFRYIIDKLYMELKNNHKKEGGM